MTQNRYYANLAQGTYLANVTGLSNAAATMQTSSAVNWPALFPFVVSIEPATANEELVLVTAGSGTALNPYNITRGFDGTTPISHPANVPIIPKICQLDLAEPQQHLNLSGSTSGAHGLPASAWQGGQYRLIHEEAISTTQASYSFTSAMFTSIPAGCNHVAINISSRTSYNSGGIENLMVQYNGYTGANYGGNYLSWLNSASPTASSYFTQTQGVAGQLWTTLYGPVGIARNEIHFPFYNDTVWSKGHNFKVTATDGVSESSSAMGGGASNLITAALTSLTFFPQHSGSVFLSSSLFSMYAY